MIADLAVLKYKKETTHILLQKYKKYMDTCKASLCNDSTMITLTTLEFLSSVGKFICSSDTPSYVSLPKIIFPRAKKN